MRFDPSFVSQKSVGLLLVKCLLFVCFVDVDILPTIDLLNPMLEKSKNLWMGQTRQRSGILNFFFGRSIKKLHICDRCIVTKLKIGEEYMTGSSCPCYIPVLVCHPVLLESLHWLFQLSTQWYCN